MTTCYRICVLLAFIVPLVTCNADNSRDEKLISTFQVVRFPNDGCVGSTTRNGTCYTSQECSNKGGTSSGSCADGFGVCCIFAISSCGMSSSENLTYWSNPTTVSTGSCSLDVIPVSDDICSLRIDFTTFAISGPSTLSIVQGRRRFGLNVENHEDDYTFEGITWTTNCLTDTFYVQGPSPSSNPPVVCGTLSTQHMYLEADIDRGNKLMFNFGDVTAATQVTTYRGISTAGARTWDMTISHIECSSLTLPPTGCTKYFWSTTGLAILTNYNFATGGPTVGQIHLAQQHERLCVRRERSKCVGCFSAVGDGTFDISMAKEGEAKNFSAANGCCGYLTKSVATAPETTAIEVEQAGWGKADNGQFGWDCVIIPGAFMLTNAADGTVDATQDVILMQQSIGQTPTTAHMNVPQGPQICGAGKGIGPGVALLSYMTNTNAQGANLDEGYNASLSVCTRNVPFVLEFMTDDIEGQGATATDSEFTIVTQAYNQGFQIALGQLDC